MNVNMTFRRKKLVVGVIVLVLLALGIMLAPRGVYGSFKVAWYFLVMMWVSIGEYDKGVGGKIINGVIIFVLGQLFLAFVIKPILDLKKITGELIATLRKNGPTIKRVITGEQARGPYFSDILKTIDDLGARLDVAVEQIPAYDVWWLLQLLPHSKRRIYELLSDLIVIAQEKSYLDDKGAVLDSWSNTVNTLELINKGIIKAMLDRAGRRAEEAVKLLKKMKK